MISMVERILGTDYHGSVVANSDGTSTIKLVNGDSSVKIIGNTTNMMFMDENILKPEEKGYYYGGLKMTPSQVRDKTVFSGYRDFFAIKRVIFNDPATIVFWKDGTKTVVKCSDDDTFNPEVGIAMCMAKKIYGDEIYHGIFRKAMKNSIVQEKEEEPKLYFCRRFGLRCKFATRYGRCIKYSKKDDCKGEK